MDQSTSGPTSVYRYYDQYDILIYVGVTSRGVARNREHNLDKDWWPFVARQEVDHLATRELALRHEAELIQQFRPPFNTRHNPEAATMRAAYLDFAKSVPHVANPVDLLRLMNGRLSLDVVESDGQCRYTLRTRLVDAEVARRLRHVPSVKVNRGGPRIGHVEKLTVRGPFALIQVHARLGVIWDGTYANFKNVHGLKSEVAFELRRVTVTAPAA